jgi:hypothetical protein
MRECRCREAHKPWYAIKECREWEILQVRTIQRCSLAGSASYAEQRSFHSARNQGEHTITLRRPLRTRDGVRGSDFWGVFGEDNGEPSALTIRKIKQ